MDKPLVFKANSQELKDFQSNNRFSNIIDTFQDQLEDLFLIRNPQYRFNKNYQNDFNVFLKKYSLGKSLQELGKWVYFPWNKSLVHFLNDDEHQEVRTARNRNLITKDEQEKFYDFKVGVAGLSVGSYGAIATALMGGSRMMKVADPDVISPSNLNRMRFDFTDIGRNKAESVACYIYQLNPFAEVKVYNSGITENNIEDFLNGLDILIEELDDIEIKVRLREEAKKRKIPVVMATDNGDGVIVDIERFDLNPNLSVFYGALDGFDLKEIKKSPQKMFEAMAKIIDLNLVPSRVLASALEVGKSIYSWPQLATAASLSGVVIAFIVRKISLKEPIKDGKLEVNLESIFNPDFKKNQESKQKEVDNFLKSM